METRDEGREKRSGNGEWREGRLTLLEHNVLALRTRTPVERVAALVRLRAVTLRLSLPLPALFRLVLNARYNRMRM